MDIKESKNYSEIYRINDDILKNVYNVIEKRANGWMLYKYTSHPKPQLDIFIDEKGKSLITLILNKNGNVTCKSHKNIHDITCVEANWTPAEWATMVVRRLVDTYIDIALNDTGKKITYSKLINAMYWYHSNQQLRTRVTKECSTALKHLAFSVASHDGEIVESTHTKVLMKMQRLIKSVFFKKELSDLSVKYFHTDRYYKGYSVREYNWINKNLKVILQMDKEAPKILSYYCREFTDLDERLNVTVKRADEITRIVKETLNVGKDEWRYFTRVGSMNHLEDTRLMLKALHDINMPELPVPLMVQLGTETNRNLYFSNANWRYGDPWKAWIHLIATMLFKRSKDKIGYVLDDEYHIYGNEIWNFRHTADALQWHIENDQPWGRTDYDSYVKRTRAWEEEIRQLRRKEYMNKLTNTNWNSLVPDTKINGINVKPVTNGLELHNLGRAMNNCIGSFVDRCNNGGSRIFIMEDKDKKLLAAVELQYNNGYWSRGQIEGISRKRAPEGCFEAFTSIRKLYQDAYLEAAA